MHINTIAIETDNNQYVYILSYSSTFPSSAFMDDVTLTS